MYASRSLVFYTMLACWLFRLPLVALSFSFEEIMISFWRVVTMMWEASPSNDSFLSFSPLNRWQIFGGHFIRFLSDNQVARYSSQHNFSSNSSHIFWSLMLCNIYKVIYLHFVLWDLTSDIFYFHLKLIFVYVEMDKEDVGKPVSDYFGVTGDGPQVSISPIFNPKFGLQLIIDISILSTILHLYDLDRFWHTREMRMPRNFFLMVKSHLIMLRLISLDPCLK